MNLWPLEVIPHPGPCSKNIQLSPSSLVCLISVACYFGELTNANINSTASPLWGGQDRQVIYQTLLKIVLQPLAPSFVTLWFSICSSSFCFLFFCLKIDSPLLIQPQRHQVLVKLTPHCLSLYPRTNCFAADLGVTAVASVCVVMQQTDEWGCIPHTAECSGSRDTYIMIYWVMD